MAASCTNVGMMLEYDTFSEKDPTFEQKIRDRYFNHGLTVIIPGQMQVPSAITEMLEEQMSYRLVQLPVFRLIEMPFVQAFVKKGQMYMLSQGTKLECHDCVAVTPSGYLVLHLTKGTYRSLGLECVKQTHMNKKNDIYVVKINLLEDSFRPGRKGYDKVLWCLKERLDLTFDFCISWVPHDRDVCSSSITIYFSDICQGVARMDVVRTSRILTSMRHPKMEGQCPQGASDGSSCSYQDVFEWMGALACGVDGLSNEEPSYESSLQCPQPSTNCPRCLVFQAHGFIPSHIVFNIYKHLRQSCPSFHQAQSLPISLTVQGFKDSPVTHKIMTPEFSMPGDSLYSFISFHDNTYWFLTAGQL